MAYNAAIVTNAGLALLAQALTGEGVITFPAVKLSSYVYSEDTDIASLTDLEDIEQEVVPFSAQIINDTVVQISAIFSNDSVESSYMIQNIGVYAQIGDNDPVLFSVNQAQQADQMPEASDVSPSSFLYNIPVVVQSTSNLTIEVNPAGTATVQDLIDLMNQVQELIAQHNTSPTAHQDIRNLINNLTSRVQRLEDMVLANVTENPFLVQFDTLDNLIVTGVWNVSEQRIEF